MCYIYKTFDYINNKLSVILFTADRGIGGDYTVFGEGRRQKVHQVIKATQEG